MDENKKVFLWTAILILFVLVVGSLLSYATVYMVERTQVSEENIKVFATVLIVFYILIVVISLRSIKKVR